MRKSSTITSCPGCKPRTGDPASLIFKSDILFLHTCRSAALAYVQHCWHHTCICIEKTV